MRRIGGVACHALDRAIKDKSSRPAPSEAKGEWLAYQRSGWHLSNTEKVSPTRGKPQPGKFPESGRGETQTPAGGREQPELTGTQGMADPTHGRSGKEWPCPRSVPWRGSPFAGCWFLGIRNTALGNMAATRQNPVPGVLTPPCVDEDGEVSKTALERSAGLDVPGES